MCSSRAHRQVRISFASLLPGEMQTQLILCQARPGTPLSTTFSHQWPSLWRERRAGPVHRKAGPLPRVDVLLTLQMHEAREKKRSLRNTISTF